MFEKLLLAATITFSLNLFSGLRPQVTPPQLSTHPLAETLQIARDVPNKPLFPLQNLLK
jgi:hypothetical protein